MDRTIAWKLALGFAVFAALFLGLWVAGGLLIGALLSEGGEAEPSSDFPETPARAPAPDAPPPPDAAPAPEPGPKPSSPEAAAWIARLSSPAYEARRLAEDALVGLGHAAVPDLEQALAHPDPEVRWRAKEALRRIRERPPR